MESAARLLERLSEQVAGGGSLDDILNFIYAEFRLLIPYNRMGYATLEAASGLVVANWARSDHECLLQKGFSAPLKGSSLELLALHRRPRILNNLTNYLARHPKSESTRLIVSEGIQSSLTCPLVTEDKVVGFLFFSHRDLNAYAEAHTSVFCRIAGQLSLELMLLNEREQWRKTLAASVGMLVEILSIAKPTVQAHATRIRPLVRKLACAVGMTETWHLELAAMLCLLGCVAVPDSVIDAWSRGWHLDPGEQAAFDSHVAIGQALIERVPELSPVADIIGRQAIPFESGGEGNDSLAIGGSILRLALEYDQLRTQGLTGPEAHEQLSMHRRQFAPGLIDALSILLNYDIPVSKRSLKLSELRAGMILAEDVCTTVGRPMLRAQQPLTDLALKRLLNHAMAGDSIREPIQIYSDSDSLGTLPPLCREDGAFAKSSIEFDLTV